MSVKKEADGRRSVQAEVEVPGSPEEVWRAIATGPGMSAWFVPSEVEEREGGKAISHFSPDGSMDSVGKITKWQPPHQFVVETEEESGLIATEWIVEAHSGGTCTVRVVHNWSAESDDWDEQFVGHTYGWLAFFRVLKQYLTHFSGQFGVSFQVMGTAPEPQAEAWAAFTGQLGIAGAGLGDRFHSSTEAPPLGGIVEWATQPEGPEEFLLRLHAPAPGVAHIASHAMGGAVYLWIRCHFYGEGAADVASREETAWTEWMAARFPMQPWPQS
jgi:uncharacterized protein YndB with AHSA1/START domain